MGDRLVFGIGLPRTGTSSLRAAMRMFGYNAFEDPFADDKLAAIQEEGPLDVSPWVCSSMDYMSEPLWYCIPRLAASYPDALFLNTHREAKAWQVSLEAFSRRPESIGRTLLGDLPARHAQQRREVDELALTHEVVDLGVCSESSSELWEKLCSALHAHVPPIPFPYKNRRKV